MANYTIVNDDELANFLVDLIEKRKNIKYLNWHFCNKIYANHYNGVKPIYNDTKSRERIEKAVVADINRWREKVLTRHRSFKKKGKKQLVHFVFKKFDMICTSIGGTAVRGKRLLLDLYLNSQSTTYMKELSNGIYTKSSYRTIETYSFPEQDCLIRNILNNEDLLRNKIKNNYPFWFVDSGYTNFTRDSENKVYQRLCRSDTHAEMPKHVFPMNRLLQLVIDSRGRLDGFKFPQHWRTVGDTVLIIPPSNHVCSVYGLDQDKWINQQQKKLKQVTDKKIVIRQKIGTRKDRVTLYKDLLDDQSVYCVVGYNSNALTEAVWAGVPIITLGKHITNPVSRNSIDKINNLYRDDISQWLCYLSYSQFTNKELLDGTAKKIMEIWHV